MGDRHAGKQDRDSSAMASLGHAHNLMEKWQEGDIKTTMA